MHIIVINSQKGGSGKTMLCKHLAVEAERAGDGPIFLIDTDPQGSLSAWHAKREANHPVLADVPFEGIAKGLEVLRHHGAEYCIIDTASGRLDIASDLFKLANQNLKQAGAPFVFVLTRVKPNTLITAQAAAVLSRHGQVADTFIGDRTGYKSRWEKGQTVTEAEPKGPAAKEVAALWRSIKSCLHADMETSQHEKVVHG
jgi:chromosome partitioning protein